MNAPAWVPVAGLFLTALVAILGGVAYAIRVSWRLGQTHEQHLSLTKRVEALETEAKSGEDHRSAVKLLNQALDSLKHEMQEVKDTLKDFINSAPRPRRRTTGD